MDYSIKNVSVVELICVTAAIGDGTKENPVRLVGQYWDKKGNLLFVRDSYEPDGEVSN